MQLAQTGVVETLDAHADSVHAHIGQQGDIAFVDIVGINLDREFGNAHSGQLYQHISQLPHQVNRQLRWRSTPDVDGLHALVTEFMPAHARFGNQSGHIALHEWRTHRGVKIAIGASRLAERDVNINTSHHT